jgi:hypothetical protein
MSKASKKRPSTKDDVIIKAKATTTRIIDINNEIARLESNDKGQVTGKYYSGVHWDTVEATMLSDGSATETGTQSPPNKRGIAQVTGEGTMWTSASRLSQLNGGRWTVNGEVNTMKETVKVRGNFTILNT